MELKLKLKYMSVILFIFMILICIDWYGNMDYVNIYQEEHSNSLSKQELIVADKTYNIDYSKNYHWKHITVTKETKGNFPFTFNKVIVKKTEPELLEYKY